MRAIAANAAASALVISIFADRITAVSEQAFPRIAHPELSKEKSISPSSVVEKAGVKDSFFCANIAYASLKPSSYLNKNLSNVTGVLGGGVGFVFAQAIEKTDVNRKRVTRNAENFFICFSLSILYAFEFDYFVKL
jgi:hypothetical protein